MRSSRSRTSASTLTPASTGGAWRAPRARTCAPARFDQGFSTLTMQLARNLFPERIPGRARTLGRKLLEVRVAREIEERYGKDEILELYLNHIYFGQGMRGIEAAARHYFARPAASLTLAESALLAALPKAPSHYEPRAHPEAARARRDLVLRLMERQGRVPAEAARAARAEPLGVTPAPPPRAQDPLGSACFAEEVRAELERALGDALYAQPVRVWTTLDVAAAARGRRGARAAAARDRERQARPVFAGPAYAPGPQQEADYLQGAVVALDVRDGDVLAWVGGRDSRPVAVRPRGGRAPARRQRLQAVRLRGGARPRASRSASRSSTSRSRSRWRTGRRGSRRTSAAATTASQRPRGAGRVEERADGASGRGRRARAGRAARRARGDRAASRSSRRWRSGRWRCGRSS